MLSPQRVASLILLNNLTFYISVLLVITLTHRHIVLSLFSYIKDVKSQILLKCLCIPTTSLQLSIFDVAVPVETFDIGS